jgi:hypothetical protein
MPTKYAVRVSAITAAVIAGVATDAWAGTRIDYTIDMGVENNDNVAYTAFDPIAQRYLRAGLGFSVTESSSTLQMNLIGRADYRDYHDVFSSTLDGQLGGQLDWAVVPERLLITAENSLSLQPVDALSADSPGNRQQVNVFALGPTLLFNMPSGMRGRAELRFIDDQAQISNQYNSHQVAAALRAIKEFSPVTRLSANVQMQQVNFDHNTIARDYNRYDMFGRISRSLAHFELGADLGYSHVDYQRGEKSRTDPLMQVDVNWHPTANSQFTLNASDQFSDTATDALRSLEAPIGETPVVVPQRVQIGNAVINGSPYVMRSAGLGYTYTGPRLHFAISPYVQKRHYTDSDLFDQKGQGGSINLEWTIRPPLKLATYAVRDKLDYTMLDRQDQVQRVGAQLHYRWTRHLGVNLQWERYKRESSAPGQNITQNMVYLNISYSNH